MFCAVYSEESFVRSQLPTCQNFFNVFHPSDLVAYRIEPLIKQYSYDSESPEIKPFDVKSEAIPDKIIDGDILVKKLTLG